MVLVILLSFILNTNIMNLPVKKGDTGEDVTKVQLMLKSAGYSLYVDGVFGSGTESKVMDFQNKKQLLADGVVGFNTYKTLHEETNQGQKVKTKTFTGTLTSNQKEVIKTLITQMKKQGITNKFTQAAILAIVSKETGFIPVSETSYRNTSNVRIRRIFQGWVSDLTDEQLDTLKNNDVAFYNKVYGGRYGNAKNEGYKYRGRGLNGITFKQNYERYNSYTEADIVAEPEKLEDLEVAAEVLIGYFKDQFNIGRHVIFANYGILTINSADNLEAAVGAAYHANAGLGVSMKSILADSTGGRKKAVARAPEMLVIVDFLG